MTSDFIVGMKVHGTTYADASGRILEWAERRCSRYVCVATVNNVMEAWDSAEFRRVMNEADLVTPDGMPLVWGLKLLGRSGATRVYGPDLTPIVLRMAAEQSIRVGFYGGSPAVLGRLQEVVRSRFPQLQIAYAFSPPFRPLTPEEDEEVITAINASGARILFIGLNTPKQDFWMAAHKNRVQCCDARGRRGFRLSGRFQGPGPALDDVDRNGMVIPAFDRTAQIVEAVLEA